MLKKCLALISLSPLLFTDVAACGDNSAAPTTPDAPPVTPPPDAPADATPCDMASYPAPIERLSVDLQQPFNLTLDGVGTRCEQIIRALTDPDPTKRPPELARLDANGVTGTCFTDPDINADVIRLHLPLYGGLPLYGDAAVQDVLVHIGHPALALIGIAPTVIYLHGDFFAAGATTNMACIDAEHVASSMPGRSLSYGRFASCTYEGDGAYAIASDDTIEVGDEGLFVDPAGKLHRVRAVDVYLAAAHVTSDISNSDAYCCNTDSYDHCVGQKMFVDVVTGETIGQTQHCHTCLREGAQ